MEAELPPTIEECHSLIRQLLGVIDQLQTEMKATQTRMQAEIDELKAQLNRNSGNSNQPPSSDGFKRNRRSQLPTKKGHKGGQTGHSGETLRMISEPDLVTLCEPGECHCGTPVWVGEGRVIEKRQVFDMPEQRLEVTEYRRVRRHCQCGQVVAGKFPKGVSAPVQYGRRVSALTTLLSVHGCLSYRKIGQLFRDMYGAPINEATIQRMITETAAKIPIEQLKKALSNSETAHFDESGLHENGKLKWLHTASTAELTYQFVHPKRGLEAMQSNESVLPDFKGTAIHDCWASYFRFSEIEHAVCNAHILRELAGIIENQNSNWGVRMQNLLKEMYLKSNYARGVISDFDAYEQRYDEILEIGEQEEPEPFRRNQKGKLKRTPGRNLLERLKKYKAAVLLFARRAEIPFTNNQAERDIRALKVKQKVCGSFRSAIGSSSYAKIHSFISTLRKMKRQVFQEITEILEGKPFVLFHS